MPPDLEALLQSCVTIAEAAGQEICRIYQSRDISCTEKEDRSPLTEADIASHKLIVTALKELTPDIPVISEEDVQDAPKGEFFWLVDPLDGTKEFLNRNGEFTVNIALINNHVPVLGVVLAPAIGACYIGGHDLPARKRSHPNNPWSPISTNSPPAGGEIIVGSRSHGSDEMAEWIQKYFPHADFCGIGSSLKFCLIAEGKSHIYPRFGRTMEWDTAAGHAVLNAAGGKVFRRDGHPLSYGKPDFANPHFIAAYDRLNIAA
jgi:3'(2'), 5'-bisphosphate nucleotidase